jgi:hypothetical protein
MALKHSGSLALTVFFKTIGKKTAKKKQPIKVAVTAMCNSVDRITHYRVGR